MYGHLRSLIITNPTLSHLLSLSLFRFPLTEFTITTTSQPSSSIYQVPFKLQR
ncbi:hypothetical protein HanRHA438_Chr00c09g0847851 [Helianthus annuus]|uniref:Uncharacterized protein n=1 Tax=Helianthus annuus TaxID=4232 RepID=A0A251UM40_HELAN|nr:hypothetical protein HanXRQr2_Chr05g0196221 [Helianthus annuus]KAJ0921280.1 hypothetical protein HanPSC8_Chr05g0189661 [Helianthus annuus]KAJ0954701.1 hypothetical protein HanRHA438_Chr00c09g0847851 [Helianthus annuus]